MDPTTAAIGKTNDAIIAVVQAGAIGVAAVLAFFAVGSLFLFFYIWRSGRQDRKESGSLLKEVIGIQGQLFMAVQQMEANGRTRDQQLQSIQTLVQYASDGSKAANIALGAISQAISAMINDTVMFKEASNNNIALMRQILDQLVANSRDVPTAIAENTKKTLAAVAALPDKVFDRFASDRELDTQRWTLIGETVMEMQGELSHVLNLKAMLNSLTAQIQRVFPSAPPPQIDDGDTGPLPAQSAAPVDRLLTDAVPGVVDLGHTPARGTPIPKEVLNETP